MEQASDIEPLQWWDGCIGGDGLRTRLREPGEKMKKCDEPSSPEWKKGHSCSFKGQMHGVVRQQALVVSDVDDRWNDAQCVSAVVTPADFPIWEYLPLV